MNILSPSRLVALVAVVAMVLTLGVTFATAGADKAGSTRAKGSKACVHGTALLERNKRNVVAFYQTAFNVPRDPAKAVALYGGAQYIQHNPLADNGFAAFIGFVTGFAAAFPDLHIDIRRVIAECDLVVTHGVVTAGLAFGPHGSKVVDIFRLDEHGKIVEHWDVLAPISDSSVNGNPEV